MLTIETKRHIDAARQILVGKVPDPKSQIDQITNALIYKFMDDMDDKSRSVDGRPSFFVGDLEKYSWHKLMDDRLGSQERLNLYVEALEKFSTAAQLPQLFRDIFRQAFLPYRDPATLNLFLKEIEFFDYNHSEELGNAFEYLLSIMGAQGDAGQFRTPRHIIDFIVDVIDPNKDDTILDPACGTAGFLISAYNHIVEKHDGVDDHGEKNVEMPLTFQEKQKLMGNLEGYDISSDMVKLARVNMYLHGNKSPKIFEYDSLTSEERWADNFDIIMANPPFMTPKGGIQPHKKFGVESSRAEVLFVDYILSHLKQGGQAGVIVPEGIIFQSGKGHTALRKLLIDNGLWCVVSLPAGVFNPYSGVKTSILFINQRLAERFNRVLFVTVNNDGFDLGAQRRPIAYNDLPNALTLLKECQRQINEGLVRQDKAFPFEDPEHTISAAPLRYLFEQVVRHEAPLEAISAHPNHTLQVNRYIDPSTTQNQKWPQVELGDVCEVSTGNTAPQDPKLFANGSYPFFRTSDVGTVHYSTNLLLARDHLNEAGIAKLRLFKKGTILFPKSGASTFLNHRVILGTDGYVSSHLATITADKTKALPQYIYYLLTSVDARNLTADQSYPSLRASDISKIKIPLPPLEIQQQIVSELGNYQNIIDGAAQIVKSYKPEISFEATWPKVMLSELVDTVSPKYKIKKSDIQSHGPLPVIDQSQNYIAGYTDRLEARIETDGLIAFGDHTRAVKFINFDFAQGADGIKILKPKSSTILPKFLYYALLNTPMPNRGYSRHWSDVKELKISVPPLDTQAKIVSELDELEKAIELNQNLVHVFKQKSKNKIDEIWN